MKEKLIEINNLKFSIRNNNKPLEIIRGFDMHLDKGKIIGILGESGSGKTVSATSILQLMDRNEASIDSGQIIYENQDLSKLSEKELNKIRGKKISYIFQNPSQALNPYKKIGNQLKAVLKTHKLEYSKKIITDTLKEVGIKDPNLVYNMYPFQLSGGQNQRIMIAQGIISRPNLLIADEPTSSIDASLKKKILDLFMNINKKYDMSIIIITHDFNVANYICDSLLIMYGGLVVETGAIKDILETPMHPYTEELIKCAYSLDNYDGTLYSLEGSPPTPYEFENECPFYNRCKIRDIKCKECIPPMVTLDDRKVRCLKR